MNPQTPQQLLIDILEQISSRDDLIGAVIVLHTVNECHTFITGCDAIDLGETAQAVLDYQLAELAKP